MNKLLLPLFIMASAGTAFGQAGAKHNIGHLFTNNERSFTGSKPLSNYAAKSTTLSDTMYYYNNSDSLLFDASVALKYDGLTPADSGYLFGTNSYSDKAFAEMYDFTWGQDTLVNVIGLVSAWAGNISPTSTDSLTFHIWGLDTATYQLNTNVKAGNFPGASLGEKKVPLTGLNTGNNQLTTIFFNAPVYSIHGNFYAGYSIEPDSLHNSSFGLRSTDTGLGQGTGQYQIMQDGDTLLIARNAVMESDGYWYDVYNDYGANLNLSLVPIFQVRSITGIRPVTHNGLSLLGNAPNPAINSTNINFALQQPENVTIQLTDLNGKILRTIEQHNLGTGNYSVPVDLQEYPAGNYIYILRTSGGAAMAGMFSIVK